MKIVIVGSGYIGLSAALTLLEHDPALNIEILFSTKTLSASQVAAGLINPVVGLRGNIAYQAWNALEYATSFIEKYAPSSILHRGICRPITTPEMEERFKKACGSEVRLCSPEETSLFFENPKRLSSLYISKGLALDSSQYIDILKAECLRKGVLFTERHITSIDEIENSDRILLAAGAGMKTLVGKALGPLSLVKGQTLSYRSDVHIQAALAGRAYLTTAHGCMTVGATYEHFPQVEGVDIEEAERIILPKIDEYWPGIVKGKPISAQSGFRCTNPVSLPVIRQIKPEVWAIGALGSKGLLYHTWIAKYLAQALIHDSPSFFPQEFDGHILKQ